MHYRSLDDVHLHRAWVTIGSFDGVHRGHQEIVKNLVAGAHSAGAPAVVLTFEPHPSIILGKRREPFYLTTPEQRADLLGELGIDAVVTHPFSRELASKTAREFMNLVHRSLELTNLWVGYDFALGKGREGTVDFLTGLGAEMGFTVHGVPPVKVGGQVVSSSLIRAALAEGDVRQAAFYLGRPHFLEGLVIAGDRRGRTIGIPTANIDIHPDLAFPKSGVYACHAKVEGRSYFAMTNVGFRPTFEHQPVKPRIESLLLDYEGDLYGSLLRLEFIDRIRDEQKFDSVQLLLEQIQRDVETGRQILEREFNGGAQ